MKSKEIYQAYQRNAWKRYLRTAATYFTTLAGFGLVGILLIGYEVRQSRPSYPLLTEEGRYSISEDEWIEIQIDESDEFVVTVRNDEGILVSNKLGSKYHRWYLFVEDHMNIWIWSSDVGAALIARRKGDWMIDRSPNLMLAPRIFKAGLPGSITQGT